MERPQQSIEITIVQGVPTSLEYTKCNVLKLRKVCEQSELLLQKEPKKGELFEIRPFSLGNENGRISNSDPIKRGEF